MTSQKRFTTRALALFLALAVLQVYVQAALFDTTPKAAAPAAQGAQPMSGRLMTRGDKPVTVNGNSAKSGETIFSGQQIQTPDGVGATVTLPGLGRVEIAPNTNATITFENGRLDVNVVSGCVVLHTDKGVAGSVETAGGATQHTDASKASSVDTCVGKKLGAAGAAGGPAAGGAAAGSAAGGAFGIGVPATVAALGAVGGFTAFAIAANHGNRPDCVPRGANPSPGVPRGPCD
ncbi:MAG: hypothetical protein ACJ741_17045 [Pyrinomonadaceae bacterium]